MRTLFVLMLLALTVVGSSAQQVYELPFASRDNTFELAIENKATLEIGQVEVTVKGHPDWMMFKAKEVVINQISGGEEKPASFVFSLDKTAPVKKEGKVTFVIKGPSNQQWTKDITVAVGPPETFELFQNYPNPFNPSTTISYQLTTDSRVRLKIYNMLGQEVIALLDGDRPAGFHQEVWNASAVASGTYIYRLIAVDASGKEVVEKKMMTLIK